MLRRHSSRNSAAVLLDVLPTPLRLIITTQFAFNVGFYLVVPFLAAHLLEDLAMAAWMVGLVLGLRTFSQQGLFFVGGALADRFGIKASILIGCGVRILGFLTLSVARDVPGVMLGVVLVGVAAALFSPAVESAIVAWATDVERQGGPRQEEIIGLEIMASKLGTVVGPVLGAVVLVVPFSLTCLIAAGIFTLVLVAHIVWLPNESRVGQPAAIRDSVREVLRNRCFLTFATIHCVYLVSYNQLYLAMPVELERIDAPSGNITWLFGLAAVFTLSTQLPLTRLVGRWSTGRVLGWGYGLMGVAFGCVALGAVLPSGPGMLSYLPVVLFVLLLHLGQILVLPAARTTVAALAGGRLLGSYLGMLASVGGLAVLVGGTGIGVILPWATTPQPQAAVPWLVLAVLPAISSVAAVVFCRRHAETIKKEGK